MSKVKKIDKKVLENGVEIDYSPIDKVKDTTITQTVETIQECMALQKKGWIVINIYRVNDKKVYVLIKE